MKIEITGETKVFRKDFSNGAAYSTQIGKKKPDETWDNAYIQLKFKQGVDITDGTKIDVKKGWLTFYINKDNKPVWYLFISEFTKTNDVKDGGIPEGFQALEDDEDTPFFNGGAI